MDQEVLEDLIRYEPNQSLQTTLSKEIVTEFREAYNNKAFVGHRIALRRKELGMPQTHIARVLGVKRELISMIETGRAEINAGDLPVFGKILNVSPDFFIGTDDQGSSNHDQIDFERHNIKSCTFMLRRLPRGGQEAVLKIIKTLYDALNGGETQPENQ